MTETDEAKRQTILRLLAEEEAKRAAPTLTPHDQRRHQQRYDFRTSSARVFGTTAASGSAARKSARPSRH